jgi:hypothetical protein
MYIINKMSSIRTNSIIYAQQPLGFNPLHIFSRQNLRNECTTIVITVIQINKMRLGRTRVHVVAFHLCVRACVRCCVQYRVQCWVLLRHDNFVVVLAHSASDNTSSTHGPIRNGRCDIRSLVIPDNTKAQRTTIVRRININSCYFIVVNVDLIGWGYLHWECLYSHISGR